MIFSSLWSENVCCHDKLGQFPITKSFKWQSKTLSILHRRSKGLKILTSRQGLCSEVTSCTVLHKFCKRKITTSHVEVYGALHGKNSDTEILYKLSLDNHWNWFACQFLRDINGNFRDLVVGKRWGMLCMCLNNIESHICIIKNGTP